jgi:DNA (cytosine-5)-methyltransferase 1
MTNLYYDFFAGGGMVQAGLGPNWFCPFANDIDRKKALSYATNWGEQPFVVRDVAKLSTADLPGAADVAWASFPCQDLSLAGGRAGLKGDHSGTFWPFWNLMKALRAESRAPPIIVLENVEGLLTSNDGKDFTAICAALASGGYRFGAMLIDAAHFLPHSRKRLFVVAVDRSVAIPTNLVTDQPMETWHPQALITAQGRLSPESQDAWIWWRLPPPPKRKLRFAEVLEDDPPEARWHTDGEIQRLLEMMSPIHLASVENAKRARRRMVGALYKRTRINGAGVKVQRVEIRFDDIAGCLRTPGGGSSRQTVMIVKGDLIRSRLLSPREAAGLMGLPDEYMLPSKYKEAYHLVGDGVAVPVVRFLAAHILEPIIAPTVSDQLAV